MFNHTVQLFYDFNVKLNTMHPVVPKTIYLLVFYTYMSTSWSEIGTGGFGRCRFQISAYLASFTIKSIQDNLN